MGERYRLLGGYRGGGDMRIGSLVSYPNCTTLGMIIKQGNKKDWLILWTYEEGCGSYEVNETELVVICE